MRPSGGTSICVCASATKQFLDIGGCGPDDLGQGICVAGVGRTHRHGQPVRTGRKVRARPIDTRAGRKRFVMQRHVNDRPPGPRIDHHDAPGAGTEAVQIATCIHEPAIGTATAHRANGFINRITLCNPAVIRY